MTPEQVGILIALIACMALLSLFAYSHSKVVYFRGCIKNRLRALTVIYSQKREVLLARAAYYSEAGISLSPLDEEAITKVRWLHCEIKNAKEAVEADQVLSALEKRQHYLAAVNPMVKNGKRYELYEETMGDLTFNYRRVVSAYNSEVQGYNYWRGFILFRWLYFLFRLPYYSQIG